MKAEKIKSKYHNLKGTINKFLSNTKITPIKKDYEVDMNLDNDLNERLIGENLRQISRNLEDTGASLKSQGESLHSTQHNVRQTDQQVGIANRKIAELSYGQKCQLILLNIIAILLFLFIIVIIVLKILK
jgi:cell division protein FtsL